MLTWGRWDVTVLHLRLPSSLATTLRRRGSQTTHRNSIYCFLLNVRMFCFRLHFCLVGVGVVWSFPCADLWIFRQVVAHCVYSA